MQELGTIIQENLKVKIIIFNNYRLGMVCEMQRLKNNCRYNQVFLDCNPDFVKLGNAYGIKGETIGSDKEVSAALERMLKLDGPYILECRVNPDENTL
jgi:acetolactate synthase-1/2/3 large subunit